MTQDLIVARVSAVIADIAGPDRIPDRADADTPLGEDGYWLDSLDVLEVILACEREFGIVFDAGSELTADTLISARRLAALIAARAAA